MAAKKIEPVNDENVDMEHIKEMMGPVPNESDVLKAAEELKKKGKGKKAGGGLGESLREFNDALKAKMPGLGDADIEKVTDNDEANLPKIAKADGSDPDGDSEASPDFGPGAEPEATEPATAPEIGAKTGKKVPEEPPAVIQETNAADAEKIKDEIKLSDDIDDPSLDKAVEDIIATETDQLLAMEDEKRLEAEPMAGKKITGPSLKDRFDAWLHRPGAKWLAVYLFLGTILALALIPPARYFILNTFGVRVSSSVIVVDELTQQPLKNATITIGNESAKTGTDGKAVLNHIKQGPQNLSVSKSAFADVSQRVTLGWGSNPLGTIKLKAVGNRFTFVARDFLSDKPVTKAEASSGEGSAVSDKNGKIVLTLETRPEDIKDFKVKITAEGFRDETITLSPTTKQELKVKMVPSRKHVYISKKSGTYDVFTVDADGKNAAKIVTGTGLERDDIKLISHPTEPVAVLVSSRENVRTKDGFLLSTLYKVNVVNGELTKIDQSERLIVFGWTSDQRVVYVKIASGASANNPKRQRLVSYSTKLNGDSKEIATSNSFNDVMLVGDKVYFAPSAANVPVNQTGLFRANADGSSKVSILDKEVWNILRTDYDTLSLSVQQDWYTHKIAATDATKAAAAPAVIKSRLYITNQDRSKALWIDSRDGKGVLLNYTIANKKEDSLVSRSGVKNPVNWLNDHYVIYRVNDGRESADYVLNTEGGLPQKITDVTDSGGVETWYYY